MDNKEKFYSGIQHVIGNQIERISNLEHLLLILHKNGVVSHKELSKQIGMTEEELEKNYRRIWILPFNSRWTIGINSYDKTYRLTDAGIEYCLSKYGAE